MAKILIVDDETNIIKTLGAIIQDEGHTVFSCKTGGDALDFVQKNGLPAPLKV